LSVSEFVPVNEPKLCGNEARYLKECIDTGWISSEGPFVSQFEHQFAAKVGRRFGIAATNGSAALEAAIAALDIGPGDEVIMPTFTIISCAAAVVRAGAKPVLVDCEPDTWNMDVGQIEAKISAKTKAIMAVHIYGLPAAMAQLLEITSKYGLRLIEDAAQMHGQFYDSKPCGSFGDLSTFSFYPNKHITTGEGGMIVTDDEALADRCRSLRNLCFQPAKRFVHEELGWNFRMSNLQAAIGLAQLEKLDEFISQKRRMGSYYAKRLCNANCQIPLDRTEHAENIYWVFGVVLPDLDRRDASALMGLLAERKIGTRPFFWPMHEQPVFRKMGLFEGESYPVAERIARKGFYLPSGLGLTSLQQEQVISAFEEVLE